MAKLTSKGRGRPRKAISDDRVNRQAEGDNSDRIGDGSVGGSELEPQTDATRASERCTYARLVNTIKDLNNKNSLFVIVRAWHPAGKGLTIETNKTDVVIAEGEASYQYTDGHITKL